MLKAQNITIELAIGTEDNYIVKDKTGITIGRIYLIEMSKENKYASFRLKFYKSAKDSYDILKQTLYKLLNSLIRGTCIYKVNILTDDEVNINAFIDLGFELEGILTDNIISDGYYSDELIFGIKRDTFELQQIEKKLMLKGENIELKVLTPQNAKEVLDYYVKNKQHLQRFEPTREDSFYTLEYQRQILIDSYKQFINGISINMGIYIKGRFIGKIQLSNIVMGVFRSAFIGYSIDEDEQGKGYMKEALRIMTQYSFKKIGLHRIEASTLIDNDRSQGVLKACGFKELGINKEYLFINGRWSDHITFYLVNKN